MNQKDLTDYDKAIMNCLESGLADRVVDGLGELDEALPRLITDYAFASVIGRKGLDLKTSF